MAKKIALGKGIASLINETPNDLLKASLAHPGQQAEQEEKPIREMGSLMININTIKANPNQPRKVFKDKELQELSASIKENGVIQPLIVAKGDKGFDLIAGERRLRAAKMAGIEKIPVVIKKGTDRDKIVMAIIENVQRSDLNCVEEALAYYQLLTDYNLTQEEVAKKLGKERSTVANFLRILKLPREVVELLQKEELSFGHGKILAGEKDRGRLTELAVKAVEDQLSVRELEELIKQKNHRTGERSTQKKFFNDKLEHLKSTLEKKTGYHFGIKTKKNGAGEIFIKFSNEAEFNDIYEYLLDR